jgi:hypothetical protein
MVFSGRMISEVVQPFWQALQRGAFITGAAESVGSDRVQGRRWIVGAGECFAPRCDNEALDSDVVAVTANGQRLGRGCGPLVLVDCAVLRRARGDSRFAVAGPANRSRGRRLSPRGRPDQIPSATDAAISGGSRARRFALGSERR